MHSLSLFCPAKINLFLNISDKQADNYHHLQSLFHTLDLYDELVVSKQQVFEFVIDSKSQIEVQTKDYDLRKNNLLETIYLYFVEHYHISPIKINLTKNIPLGAGLGGGSSDAAGLIIAIDKLFNLSLTLAEQQKIGFLFGCDIPYFFIGGLAWVSGKGEIIESLASPFLNCQQNVLLFYPNVFISTAKSYQNYVTFKKIDFQKIKADVNPFIQKQQEGAKWTNVYQYFLECYCYNAFQEKLLEDYPLIKECYSFLQEQCAYTLISGSGSTLFSFAQQTVAIEKYHFLQDKGKLFVASLLAEGVTWR